MLKRFFIISICLSIGIFFTSIAFSQDDPSTTDPAKEDTTDETKTELKDETKKEEVKKEVVKAEEKKEGQQTTIAANAKVYTDGKTIFVNSKVQFKLATIDDLAIDKIEYKIDDAAAAVYQNPFSIEKEGYHNVKYYGTDKAGNKEAEKNYNVVVDNTGPAIVVSTNTPVKKIGDKVFYPKNLLFSISANDALSGVNKIEYSLDGTNYQEYAAPFAIPTKGDVSLKVRATDNVANLTDQFGFRVVDDAGNNIELKDIAVKLATDETAPTVEIKPDKELKKIDSYNVTSTDVKYTLTAKDEESGLAAIFYRLDGKGDFIPYKDVIQFMNNGKHQIDAQAVDKVGNMSNIITLTVYVDILPPNSNIETVEK